MSPRSTAQSYRSSSTDLSFTADYRHHNITFRNGSATAMRVYQRITPVRYREPSPATASI